VSERDKRLIDDTGKDIRRMEKREKSPANWAGIAFYGGAVGLLFAVPIVAGAYLGRWLDSLAAGYSVRWTVSLIVLGIAVGAYNAYRFMKGRS